MEQTKLLRAILPDVLIDNFDVVSFDKTDSRFDIYLDEKKVQMREDKKYGNVISHGFGDYHVIQDFPIRGRATYLHVRKRKWLDKDTGEIRPGKILTIMVVADERICDGFYYATFFKHFRRLVMHPELLDTPPEEVQNDID